MSKPIVFFSHSSKDKEILIKLKEMYCEKTGGAIDVFLSSDGQSIPLGRNWVYKVEEALKAAAIMIVFVTPAALRSHWLYFEAGFAYSKKIRVVPVGFLGVDLSQLRPPLSLLQGFNIANKDGLDNLIALTRDEFKLENTSPFTEVDFSELLSAENALLKQPFGSYLPLINEIVLRLTDEDGLNCSSGQSIKCVNEVLSQRQVEYGGNQKETVAFGMAFTSLDDQGLNSLKVYLDPAMLDSTLPIIAEIINMVQDKDSEGPVFKLSFDPQVECELATHKLTARLAGSGVQLGTGSVFLFGCLEFGLSHSRVWIDVQSSNDTYILLAFRSKEKELDVNDLGSLIKLLFERRVLYPRSGGIISRD